VLEVSEPTVRRDWRKARRAAVSRAARRRVSLPPLDRFDPERWAELEKVLDVALELEPAERRAYVDRVCQRRRSTPP
jgi:hypothetical protein